MTREAPRAVDEATRPPAGAADGGCTERALVATDTEVSTGRRGDVGDSGGASPSDGGKGTTAAAAAAAAERVAPSHTVQNRREHPDSSAAEAAPIPRKNAVPSVNSVSTASAADAGRPTVKAESTTPSASDPLAPKHAPVQPPLHQTVSATNVQTDKEQLLQQIHQVESQMAALEEKIGARVEFLKRERHRLTTAPSALPAPAGVTRAISHVTADGEAAVFEAPTATESPLAQIVARILAQNRAAAGADAVDITRLANLCRRGATIADSSSSSSSSSNSSTQSGISGGNEDARSRSSTQSSRAALASPSAFEMRALNPWDRPEIVDAVVQQQRVLAARHRRRRQTYQRLYQAWRRRRRQAEAACPPAEQEAARQRDRYLFMAARGMDTSTLPQQRSTVLAELDTYIFEIEMDGGTAGGRERWQRSLAIIPDQEEEDMPASTARIGSGSVRMEDPLREHYHARAINPWSEAEQMVLVEKFLVYYKDFHKIASFLEHKTTEDCVAYYFQNKIRLGLRPLYREYQAMRRANGRLLAGAPPSQAAALAALQNPFPHTIHEPPRSYLSSSGGVVGILTAYEREWSEDELGMLMQALVRFGTQFRAVANFVGTRTAKECLEFFRMNRRRLDLDKYLPPPPPPPSVAAVGGATASQARTAAAASSTPSAPSISDAEVSDAADPIDKRPASTPARSMAASAYAVWSPEEEIQFAEAFSEIGTDWRRLAQLIPTKTPEQIYTYWQQQAMSAARQSRRARIA